MLHSASKRTRRENLTKTFFHWLCNKSSQSEIIFMFSCLDFILSLTVRSIELEYFSALRLPHD